MAKAEFDMPETPTGTPVQVDIDFPFALVHAIASFSPGSPWHRR
jgi:hypothetical protein